MKVIVEAPNGEYVEGTVVGSNRNRDTLYEVPFTVLCDDTDKIVDVFNPMDCDIIIYDT